jgi:hypothetical protein
MEILEKIKSLFESLDLDTTKFYKGNKSAGIRARKTAQELKGLLQNLRLDIINENKKEGNE